ncbi:1-phosphofructokinase family hexose kinase, partial [Burkholderia cepacia]
ASGKRQAASGKRQAASGKRQAASGEGSHPDCSGIQCAVIDQRACRRSTPIHVRTFPQLPRRESRGTSPGNPALYAHKPTGVRRNRPRPFRSETPIVLIRRTAPRSVIP